MRPGLQWVAVNFDVAQRASRQASTRFGYRRLDTGVPLAEVIQDEIKGKKTALGRYDSIIWKIRSGYAVLLYGGLSLTMKQVVQGDASLRNILPLVTSNFVLLLIAGFSLIGLLVDLSFLIQQLRVITATNELTDQLLNIATQKPHDETNLVSHKYLYP